MVTIISKHHIPNQLNPGQNHLLAALPTQIIEKLSPHLELVSMPLGKVLCESGDQLHYAYFPTSAIVSLHYVMENGSSAEIAGVGNEGVVGISLFMGGNTTPSLATQALMTQISQTAVCNRYHSIEQQLCRWLLLTLDRLPSNELTITQELIAIMLGVRREGITEAAGNLQRAGLISYRRGHISVLDREGLESTACECYHVVKKESDRLLAIVY
jgi:Crp-like helix-turn-helix domain